MLNNRYRIALGGRSFSPKFQTDPPYAAAWKRGRGLAQAPGSFQVEVTARIGISQSAYAQQERTAKPRKATRENIAAALGIAPDLLDV
ncbi:MULTISPECIES: hypothetical protein [Pseudomonadaceae]|uniref:Uncharacterized protein n=1 Tax=Ectopseudomonas oleovorans TaxID=301 RepID=A0A3D9EDJ6_ECTOL|nr:MULTISPECIES: hypothetical protein [Pseudomonas]RED00380.1 hypothetical protein DFO60_4535 [Pseudomonas oleovorans]